MRFFHHDYPEADEAFSRHGASESRVEQARRRDLSLTRSNRPRCIGGGCILLAAHGLVAVFFCLGAGLASVKHSYHVTCCYENAKNTGGIEGHRAISGTPLLGSPCQIPSLDGAAERLRSQPQWVLGWLALVAGAPGADVPYE